MFENSMMLDKQSFSDVLDKETKQKTGVYFNIFVLPLLQ